MTPDEALAREIARSVLMRVVLAPELRALAVDLAWPDVAAALARVRGERDGALRLLMEVCDLAATHNPFYEPQHRALMDKIAEARTTVLAGKRDSLSAPPATRDTTQGGGRVSVAEPVSDPVKPANVTPPATRREEG